MPITAQFLLHQSISSNNMLVVFTVDTELLARWILVRRMQNNRRSKNIQLLIPGLILLIANSDGICHLHKKPPVNLNVAYFKPTSLAHTLSSAKTTVKRTFWTASN